MFLLSTSLVAQIKPERVHLVDMHPRDAPRNFMFRGNSPTSKNSTTGKYQLDYDVLVSALRTAAADECNVTLPATFPAGYGIVDVDLENLFDDGYEAELKYWQAHPEQGEAIKWITLGSLLEPKHTPFRDALVANGTWAIEGNGDYLVERLAQLRSMLLSDWGSDPPTVLYVHCSAGCDRTGEFIGAYAMRYLGYNVTTAMGEACRQCGRCPNYFSSSALGWWCLTEKQNRSDVGDCLDFAGCTLFKDCHAHGPTAPANICPTTPL